MDNDIKEVNINEIERNNNLANKDIERLTDSAEEIVSILKRLNEAYDSSDTRDLITQMENKIKNIQHENKEVQDKASRAIIDSKNEMAKYMSEINEELAG